jgi:hypothetical protein
LCAFKVPAVEPTVSSVAAKRVKNQLEDYQFISSRTTDRTIIDRLEERLAETIGNLIVMGK